MREDEKASLRAFLSKTATVGKSAFRPITSLAAVDSIVSQAALELKKPDVGPIMEDEIPVVLTAEGAFFVVDRPPNIHLGAPIAIIPYYWTNYLYPNTTISFAFDSLDKGQKRIPYRSYHAFDDEKLKRLAANRATLLVISSGGQFEAAYDVDTPRAFAELYQPVDNDNWLGARAAGKWFAYLHANTFKFEEKISSIRVDYIRRLNKEAQICIECNLRGHESGDLDQELAAISKTNLARLFEQWPAHQAIYQYAEQRVQNQVGDSALAPFFELLRFAGDNADHLLFQIGKALSCALFDIERTDCGLRVPSIDLDRSLSYVSLDLDSLAEAAGDFWENLPWYPLAYPEITGQHAAPSVRAADLYHLAPVWEGEINDGRALATQLLREAHELRRATIPPGAYHPIDKGGLFRSVKLQEVADEVVATMIDKAGRLLVVVLNPRTADWRVLDHSGEMYYACIDKDLERRFGNTVTGQQVTEARDEWSQRLDTGLGVFLGALIRDFCVVEERERIFSHRQTTRNITRSHGDRSRPVTVYLPRIPYVTSSKPGATSVLEYSKRAPHSVSQHFRRVTTPGRAQLELARKLGIYVPKGHTFVRGHKRGEGERDRIYRSLSALQLLGATKQPEKGLEDDWLQFERKTTKWLIDHGWSIERWSASARGDRGIDIIAARGEELAIVQCKDWATNRVVGPDTVRSFIGARSSLQREVSAIFVTSTRLTEGAREICQQAGIKLYENVDFANPPILDV